MTDLTNTSANAATKPRPKGSKIMWVIVAVLLAVCLAGVAASVAVYMMELGRPAFAGTLTVVALSLEGAMWCTAAAVGASIFETRKRIWRFLTGKGWTAQ